MAFSGDRLMVIIGRSLFSFTVNKNTIKKEGEISLDSQPLDIQVRGSMFLILMESALMVCDRDLNIVHRQAGLFTAMAQTEANIFAVTSDGLLHTLNSDLSGTQIGLSIKADRLLFLQGRGSG